MSILQRFAHAFRSMFRRSSLKFEPPLPLFPDRVAGADTISTGIIAHGRADAAAQVRRVEFIGGPLDGYQEGLRQEDLAETFAIPVTAFALAALAGSKVIGQRRDPTSVAVYELESTLDDPVRYFFLGAASPEQICPDMDSTRDN
jgi:hypothetical protein